jgi:DNA-binding protein HU-beta
MTKNEIIKEVAAKTDCTIETSKQIIDTFIEQIKKSVSEDEPLYIRGFGVFAPTQRKAKIARDIGRGTSVAIPAYIEPTFKAYPEFKNLVNES